MNYKPQLQNVYNAAQNGENPSGRIEHDEYDDYYLDYETKTTSSGRHFVTRIGHTERVLPEQETHPCVRHLAMAVMAVTDETPLPDSGELHASTRV